MIVVQVLGSAIITCGEHRIRDPASRRFAVALYLAAEAGRRLDRAATQELLFGDLTEQSAAHSLRQYLYKLGTFGFPVRAQRTDIFVPAEAVQTDVAGILAAERLTPEQIAAIEGGVLSGAIAPELPRFNEWLDDFRARQERELQRALVRHLGASREVGDWNSAERLARACLKLDPLNEEATLGLAESLAISGSKAAAIKILEDYTAEVGVSGADLKIPANVLRRRIAERLPESPYGARKELPFVGRQEEMRVLADRLRKVRAGEGQCVLIHGEPGIGKTRLAAEFANVAVLEGARIVRVAAQPHDVHRPLAAFVDLVPLLLQLPGALGCSPESMEALRRLTGRDAPEALDTVSVDPDTRYYRTTSAIRDLIDAVATECLLAVVIEDAHWLDASSLQFIGGVIAQRSERRLLVVITSRERDAVTNHARHADRMTFMHLGPLTAEATSELASVVIASEGDDRPRELLQRIQTTAGGNPLFVVSLAQHWRDSAMRYSVPSSVSTLIQSQLEAVSPQALNVLNTVILLGRHCTSQRVAECLRVTPLDLADALQELESRALLSSDSGTTASRHWLISEAALHSAPPTTLRWLHACVAAYLERESRRQGERAILWDAAEHWVRAGEDDNAYSTLVECAAAAAAIGRLREACDTFARASDLNVSHDRRVRAIEQALTHAAASGETPRAFSLFARLRSLGVGVSPELALFEVATLMHAQTDLDTIAGRIQDLLRSSHSDEVATDAALRLVKIADYFGDEALANRARDVRAGVQSMRREAHLEFELVYQTAFGDVDQGLVAARELLALLQNWETGRRLRVSYNVAQGFQMAGCVTESLRLHADIYESGLAVGLRRMPVASALILASVSRDIGADEDCEAWTTRARALAADDPSLRNPEFLFCEGEYNLWRGDANTALAGAIELERIAREGGNVLSARLASALAVAALHLQGQSGGSRLEEINAHIRQIRGLGRDDILVYVACQELILAKRDTDACALLSDYLERGRRARAPLWFGLRALIRRYPALHEAWRRANPQPGALSP